MSDYVYFAALSLHFAILAAQVGLWLASNRALDRSQQRLERALELFRRARKGD